MARLAATATGAWLGEPTAGTRVAVLPEGVVVTGAGRQGIREIAARMRTVAGDRAAGRDLDLFDAGRLGLDVWRPGGAAAEAPLLCVSRMADDGMRLTLQYDAGRLEPERAAGLLDRIRQALETPELWLAV